VDALKSRNGGPRVADIRSAMQRSMTENLSVSREAVGMQETLSLVQSLQKDYQSVSVEDKGSVYNIDLMEAMELEHMLHIAEVMCQGALNRQESRGAHYRSDFSKRDDATWLRHTLARRDGDSVLMDYKPVTITRFEPKERTY
jgi:succinate dehydrogenase / fumarate reductase flavoprotein subunit